MLSQHQKIHKLLNWKSNMNRIETVIPKMWIMKNHILLPCISVIFNSLFGIMDHFNNEQVSEKM